MPADAVSADEPADPNPIVIQTNHGVTYPLVGPGRIKQQELADKRNPNHTRDPGDRRCGSTETVKAIAS
jgi:hypothetical protein